MLQGLFIFMVFFWKPSMLKKIRRRHPKFSKPLFCLLKIFCSNAYQESVVDNSDMPNINPRVLDKNMTRVKSCDNLRSSNINCRPIGNSMVRTKSLDNIISKKKRDNNRFRETMVWRQNVKILNLSKCCFHIFEYIAVSKEKKGFFVFFFALATEKQFLIAGLNPTYRLPS